MTTYLTKRLSGLAIIVSTLFIPTLSAAEIIYVNHAATSSGSGTSWSSAYNNLQAALQQAKSHDQIWVAAGSYYPSTSGNRQASFKIPANVTLLGGFSGNEARSTQRDYRKNLTLLDGDIQHNHKQQTYSQHVVIMGEKSVLDGFIVQHGYSIPAPGSQGHRPGLNRSQQRQPANHTTPQAILSSNLSGTGGGIVNAKAAGIVKNCIIQNNVALKGAGSYNMVQNSVPVYINDIFRNNVAKLRGAAMSNDLKSHVIIINSYFTHNHCDAKGGAIYNDFSSSTLMLNSSMTYNSANRAASIGNDGSSRSIIISSNISNNSAQSLGAALYQGSYNARMSDSYNQMVLINSTITNNLSRTNGPAIFLWSGNYYDFYQSTVTNWPWPIAQTIPTDYQPLVAIAAAVKQHPVTAAQLNTLKAYINQHSQHPGKRPPSFRNPADSSTQQPSIPKQIFYVNVNNSSKKQDGLSWRTAYSDLQTAINKLASRGGGSIWIAKGVYYPDINQQTPRASSFTLQKSVQLYGGFAGNETALNQRNPANYPVILSGNIGALLHNKLHSYHVVIGAKYSSINGVTIEQGRADGSGQNRYGGGLFMVGNDQTVTIKNTTFRNNRAYYGGAVYAFNNITSHFTNVNMINNHASMGGALYLSFGSNIVYQNGTLAHNTADYRGGAIVVNYGSNPTLRSLTFTNNSTSGVGGAIWIDDQASQFGGTKAEVSNCQFINNSAQYSGGAVAAVNKGVFSGTDNHYQNNQAKSYNNIYQQQSSSHQPPRAGP